MVMHARKIQRLNDGYHDRGQTHPFEERGKGRDGEFNDRYRKEHRDTSPRYQNKSSYLDRTKERLDRGNSDSPADKRTNHHSSSSSKDPGSSSRYPNSSNRASSSAASSKERRTEKVHKAEVQKSALRICGDWSEHLSSSKKKYYYNCKTEESKWEKPKDWIDGKAFKTSYGRAKEAGMAAQKQSSGERPKHSSATQSSNHGNAASIKRHNTMPPNSSDFNKHNHKQSSSTLSKSASSMDSRQKNWSQASPAGHREQPLGTGGRDNNSANFSNSQTARSSSSMRDGRKYEQHPQRDRDRDLYSSGGSANMSCNKPSDMHISGKKDYSRGGGGGEQPSNSRQGSSTIVTGNGGGHGRGHSSSSHYNSLDRSGGSLQRQYSDRPTYQNEECSRQSAEDMDISPGSTPTEESVARNLVMPNPVPSSTSSNAPVSMATGNAATAVAMSSILSQLGAGDKNIQRVNSQELTQQAIQTLQKLQEALLAQQRQQQQQLAQLLTQQIQQQSSASASNSNSSQQQTQDSHHHHHSTSSHHNNHHPVTENGGQSPVESEGTPYGSPDLRLPDDPGVTESSEKVTSHNNIRANSVSPSQCSSHKGYSRSLQAASLKKAEAYKLPPSLANYYNESLIHHVAGWPIAPIEQQADQMLSNSHTVGNLYSTQVSADLKKARSLVRVSEIQSTLQHQRILFLRHQTRDLENLRTTGAFMPGT